MPGFGPGKVALQRSIYRGDDSDGPLSASTPDQFLPSALSLS